MTVIRGDGLEEIGVQTFYKCTSLERINIPPTARAIKEEAFRNCDGLTTAILGVGLEEIGKYAFLQCRSLVRINIPPNVRTIDAKALKRC